MPRERAGDGPTGAVLDPRDVPVADLLSRAAEGSQESWNALVDRYTNLLWSVARAHRLETSDAADVVQTTWLRLVENLGRIQEPERLPGWLATTARRECLRTLRLRGRERPAGDDDVAFDVPDGAEPLDAGLLTDELDAQLWHCFGQVSGRCQQLLRILMADPPMSYNEISAALEIPVGSIGPTRGRCLERLRRLAEARGISLDGLGPVPSAKGVR